MASDTNDLSSLLFTAIRLMRERIAKHGTLDLFSITEFKILAFVAEKENPSMKDIANFLYITSPSATASIKRLVDAGELSRVYDPDDRRMVRLQITKKGIEILTRRKKEASARMDAVCHGLNAQEKKTFAQILTKIIMTQN